MLRILFLALALCATPALAQDLTVTITEATTITFERTLEVSKVVDVDGNCISPEEAIPVGESEPVETTSALVDIETEAGKVSVSASDSERNPVELEKINDRRYGVPASDGKTWVRVKAVDFGKEIFAEETVVVPGQEAPDPGKPQSLSQRIRKAAKAVKSSSKATDAATLAGIFRSVAGRAAGLHTMTPQSMISETDNQIASKLSSSARSSWKSFGVVFKSALEDEQLAEGDKPGHIKAWQTIAKALQSVKRSPGPILAPQPIVGPAVEWKSPATNY